jgi:hypothetical protein
MYHTFARSAGLNYWEGLAYTFLGSAMWEVVGETTPPSRNDQVTTGIGGSFLGESLFRMANLILEKEGLHSSYRELFGFAVSPATGFNRHAFGNRFKPIFPSHDGAHFTRLQLGFSGTAQDDDSGVSTTKLKRNEALADFYLEYGLPGSAATRTTARSTTSRSRRRSRAPTRFENVMTRGLLKGRPTRTARTLRGVFGLYGSFDYIYPQTFRVSSTALSLGTTAQWQMAENWILQGTGLAGAGYTGVGSVNSTTDGDYHYGFAPQALAAARLIYKDRIALDVTAREYFVTKIGAAARGGHENVARIDAALTWRVLGQHGISIKYLGNFRDAFYPDGGDSSQRRGTIGLFYTLLGNERFGA